MSGQDTADRYASRLGGQRIAHALTLAGCNPRQTAATHGGRAWIADCPACRRPDALAFADTAAGITTIRCRGTCHDPRVPMVHVHAATRLTPLTAPIREAA